MGDGDAMGGSDLKSSVLASNVRKEHRGDRLEARDENRDGMLKTWNLLWGNIYWDMLPLTALCRVRRASQAFRSSMRALQERWGEVRASIEQGDVGKLLRGLRLPRFHDRAVPILTWDFRQSRRLERRYLNGGKVVSVNRNVRQGWTECNPELAAACGFLAEHCSKCVQDYDVEEDGFEVIVVRKVTLQLQFGPIRAYMVCSEVQEVEDLPTGSSDETEEEIPEDQDARGGANIEPAPAKSSYVYPEVNDRVMTLKHPWLQKILSLEKSIELRSARAALGFVWLAKKNTIYGSATIQRCEKLTLDRFLELQEMHGVAGSVLPYDKTSAYALWLSDVQTLPRPVTFCRLSGAQGWARMRWCASDVVPERKPKKKQKKQRQKTQAKQKCMLARSREKTDPSTTEEGETFGLPETFAPSLQDVASWPRQVFMETAGFIPTANVLQTIDGVPIPETVSKYFGQILVSANTVGDGACAVHALFGSPNREGKLECKFARGVALQALELAVATNGDEPHAHTEALRLSLWRELALPGARGSQVPEPKIFWEHFLKMYPREAAKVTAVAEQEKADARADTANKETFVRQCRHFFCAAHPKCIDDICARIGYATSDGLEASFEVRSAGKIVKGTLNSPLPEGGPVQKLLAVRDENEVFDGLRTAVFLSRDLKACSALVRSVNESQKCKSCEDFAQALDSFAQSEAARISREILQPASFWDAATNVYLSAIQDAKYFFSVDELAAVAHIKKQSLVILKEGRYGSLEPCATVLCEECVPVMVLLKNAMGGGQVRSHFERLVPQHVVAAPGDHGGGAGTLTSHVIGGGNVLLQKPGVSSFEGPKPQEGRSLGAQGVEQESMSMRFEEEGNGILGERMVRVPAADPEVPTRVPGTPICQPSTPPNVFSETSGGCCFAASVRHVDGEAEWEAAVVELLRAYENGGGAKEALGQVQLFSGETTEASWQTLNWRLKAAVSEYAQSNITSVDAVHLANPFWRTCFFPLAVLFEAWGRTTGLPTIFYIDAFYALIASLLNKEITYRVGNFACRARYWAVGTAAPGSGKSPALDPLQQALLEVLQESPDMAPGKHADGFHFQPMGTHLAAVDRLRQTEGYQFFGASEGGPVLCPSWPTSSTWNQGTHVNWQRYLDAATGKGGG